MAKRLVGMSNGAESTRTREVWSQLIDLIQHPVGRRHPKVGGVGSYLELKDILHTLEFLLKSAIETHSQRDKFQLCPERASR